MERILRSTSDEFCQKLKPEAKPIYIRGSQVKGLVLRLMPAGSETWVFCYSVKEGEKVARTQEGTWPFQGKAEVMLHA